MARLPSLVLWWSAVAGVWLVVVNRWLMHWTDGTAKSAVIAGSLLSAFAASTLIGYHALWRWVPFGILGILLVGEAKRELLRARYSACEIGQGVEPTLMNSVITTTALQCRRVEITVPGLPCERLRVAQLSDLHIDHDLPFHYYASALRAVSEELPDLLVLTGDFVSRPEGLPLLEQWAALVTQAAPQVFFSLGNHDHWVDAQAVRSILLNAGAVDVGGRCLGLAREHGAIAVCGTEVPWGPNIPSFPVGIPFRLVLSHTPDNVYALADAGATIVFSGHNHGGQFRIPGLGALVVPSRYGRRFDRGAFKVADTHLIVSSGVGAGRPSVRLFCPPDVVVVDVVRQRTARRPTRLRRHRGSTE